MLAAEQRATTRRALQEKFGERNLNLSLERLEFLRRRALDEQSVGEPSPQARSTALSPQEEADFVDELGKRYGINQAGAFARTRAHHPDWLHSERAGVHRRNRAQDDGLDAKTSPALCSFAATRSRSENNPFEAALDCGACGGNAGKPNARVLAIMANKPLVREQLAKNGIAIPKTPTSSPDSTTPTTDDVDLFDLEDLPPTHRKDLLQLVRDLERAGARNSQERCARFPEISETLRGVESAAGSSPPQQRLESGAAGMGPVRATPHLSSGARADPRHQSRRAGISAFLRLPRRSGRKVARSGDDRAANRRAMDQHGALLFRGGSGGLRQRQQDLSQRGWPRGDHVRSPERSAHRPSVANRHEWFAPLSRSRCGCSP